MERGIRSPARPGGRAPGAPLAEQAPVSRRQGAQALGRGGLPWPVYGGGWPVWPQSSGLGSVGGVWGAHRLWGPSRSHPGVACTGGATATPLSVAGRNTEPACGAPHRPPHPLWGGGGAGHGADVLVPPDGLSRPPRAAPLCVCPPAGPAVPAGPTSADRLARAQTALRNGAHLLGCPQPCPSEPAPGTLGVVKGSARGEAQAERGMAPYALRP